MLSKLRTLFYTIRIHPHTNKIATYRKTLLTRMPSVQMDIYKRPYEEKITGKSRKLRMFFSQIKCVFYSTHFIMSNNVIVLKSKIGSFRNLWINLAFLYDF